MSNPSGSLEEKKKAITDPAVGKTFDGKLYLNYSMAAYEK